MGPGEIMSNYGILKWKKPTNALFCEKTSDYSGKLVDMVTSCHILLISSKWPLPCSLDTFWFHHWKLHPKRSCIIFLYNNTRFQMNHRSFLPGSSPFKLWYITNFKHFLCCLVSHCMMYWQNVFAASPPKQLLILFVHRFHTDNAILGWILLKKAFISTAYFKRKHFSDQLQIAQWVLFCIQRVTANQVKSCKSHGPY